MADEKWQADMKKKNDDWKEWLREHYSEGDIDFVNRFSRYARNEYHIILKTDNARSFSNEQLINICDGGIYHFGGNVSRGNNGYAVVNVYTD